MHQIWIHNCIFSNLKHKKWHFTEYKHFQGKEKFNHAINHVVARTLSGASIWLSFYYCHSSSFFFTSNWFSTLETWKLEGKTELVQGNQLIPAILRVMGHLLYASQFKNLLQNRFDVLPIHAWLWCWFRLSHENLQKQAFGEREMLGQRQTHLGLCSSKKLMSNCSFSKIVGNYWTHAITGQGLAKGQMLNVTAF